MFYITLCKLLFGMYQKVMLLLGIVVALVCVVLGFLSVIGWNIVAVLATVSMGIPSLILAYEKTTSKKHIEPKEDRIEQEIVEEKVILRDETIRVGRDFDQYLDLELGRGDNLKGEISSDIPINIYFVDNANFKKWSKDRNFDYEYCSESVLGLLPKILPVLSVSKGLLTSICIWSQSSLRLSRRLRCRWL